jgi:hypothetical protein
LRTVIVYQTDLPGFTPDLLSRYGAPTITLISLDTVSFSSHELMAVIRGKLRAPMLRSIAVEPIDPFTSRDEPLAVTGVQEAPHSIRRLNRPTTQRLRDRKLIAVTGSTGAPGRTRFAALLAEELSGEGSIALIDADIRSHGISVSRERAQGGRIARIPLDREERPTHIPEGEEVAVVDLGTLPGLAEAVTDRRWHGSLVNNILDRATLELTQFLREYPLLLKRIPVTYICILTGHSRELREWENKFLTLTLGENQYVLRENQLEPLSERGLLATLRIRNPRRKEIAKIATSLR